MDSANFLFCCINMDEGRLLFFQHNTAKRRCHWTVSRKNAGTGRRSRATKYRSDFDERIPLVSPLVISIYLHLFLQNIPFKVNSYPKDFFRRGSFFLFYCGIRSCSFRLTKPCRDACSALEADFVTKKPRMKARLCCYLQETA